MNRPRSQTLLLGIGLLVSCAALLLFPREISACIQQSLTLYANAVFPALFPFFILTSLVIELGFSQCLGQIFAPVMTRLFHLRGACSSVLALGLIGGYPAGANAAVSLYRGGQCSKQEAEQLMAFCNNCGPAFFFGIVGNTLLQDVHLGALLYAVHVVAALLTGAVYCRMFPGRTAYPPTVSTVIQAVSFPVALIHAVTGAFHSLLNICAFLVFFAVFLQILTLLGISQLLATLFAFLPLSRQQFQGLFAGILELTSGIVALTDGSVVLRMVLYSFLLGWGGWSVHFQTLSLITDSDLSPRPYLLGKTLHACLSAFLTVAVLLPAFRIPVCTALLLLLALPVLHEVWRKKAVENGQKVYYNRSN